MIQIAHDNEWPTGEVAHRCGCLVFTGRLPLKMLGHFAALLGPDVHLDADAAKILGARAVIGNDANIDALRKEMAICIA